MNDDEIQSCDIQILSMSIIRTDDCSTLVEFISTSNKAEIIIDMTNYVKICAIKYLTICSFFFLFLQNQLYAAGNEVRICRNPEFLSACWEKEINRTSNDKSFALLCMSRNGNAHGFFLEKNGIGFDDEAKWEFYNDNLLYILGEDCKIEIYNEYELQISECRFNGSWKVRCRVEDPASTACP